MSVVLNNLNSAADAILARPLLVKGIQSGTVVSLGVLSGVAASLHTWVIPIIYQSPSTRTKTQQFKTVIGLGFRYLQPSGRWLAAAMASTAFLCSRSTNPVVYSQWKFYATAMAILIPTGPYETTMIFPTNDRIIGMGDQLETEGKDNFGDQRDQEVDTLLTSWQNWHIGRIVAPVAALAVVVWGAVDVLPL